ncbi:MAG: DUF2892 domain-containing protein [Deltaproteobacteria bacterium]|nr:DUF2892 domain-containing protein [Deltaproteobacteria bacterium]
MKRNVGTVDRSIRVVLGLALVLAGFYQQQWWGMLGLIPFFSGLAAFCPLYRALGLRKVRLY